MKTGRYQSSFRPMIDWQLSDNPRAVCGGISLFSPILKRVVSCTLCCMVFDRELDVWGALTESLKKKLRTFLLLPEKKVQVFVSFLEISTTPEKNANYFLVNCPANKTRRDISKVKFFHAVPPLGIKNPIFFIFPVGKNFFIPFDQKVSENFCFESSRSIGGTDP